MWNPFKSQQALSDDEEKKVEKKKEPEMPKMNMLQRLAMKRIEKMNPEEREKLMKKVMTPENVQKHKDEILKQLELMKKNKQISQPQIDEAKRRLGIF